MHLVIHIIYDIRLFLFFLINVCTENSSIFVLEYPVVKFTIIKAAFLAVVIIYEVQLSFFFLLNFFVKKTEILHK